MRVNQLSSVLNLSGNPIGYNGMLNKVAEYSYADNSNITNDGNKGETITYNNEAIQLYKSKSGD